VVRRSRQLYRDEDAQRPCRILKYDNCDFSARQILLMANSLAGRQPKLEAFGLGQV
jgi:hypothetical protein